MSCRVAGGFRGCSSTFVACVAVFRHSHLSLPQVRKNQAVFARLLYAVGPTFCTHQGLSLHCEICMR